MLFSNIVSGGGGGEEIRLNRGIDKRAGKWRGEDVLTSEHVGDFG